MIEEKNDSTITKSKTTASSANAAENTSAKKVLVLYGHGIQLEKAHWNKINPGIIIKYQSLEEFLENNSTQVPQDKQYEMIIVNGHGNKIDELRKGHVAQIGEKSIAPTLDLIRICANHTNKVLISSCHAGAVMKDVHEHLQTYIDNTLKAIEVVALGGSKYTTFEQALSQIEMARTFLHNGTAGLDELAKREFPDTYGVLTGGNVYKISAPKIQDANSVPPAAIRIYSEPSKRAHNAPQQEKWWEKKQELPVDLNAVSRQFLDVALATSTHKGKKDDIPGWLKAGANINADVSSHGLSSLYLAVAHGTAELVEALLKAEDIDPNKAGPDGFPPLVFAIQKKKHPIIEKLLTAKNIDVNKPDSKGFTPLLTALQDKDYKIVESLLNADGMDPNKSNDGFVPLFTSAQEGDITAIELLINARNIDVNKTSNGQTAIYVAAQRNHINAVNALLKAENIDVNIPDADGYTPLFTAIQLGHIQIVEALVNANDVDVNKTTNGYTPLLIAIGNKNYPMIDTLLKAKDIDPNKTHPDGFTPLFIAVQSKDYKLAEALLSAKDIDPNKPNTDDAGYTPLILAANRGDVEMVNILLKHPKIKITETDLQYSATPEIEKLLIDRKNATVEAVITTTPQPAVYQAIEPPMVAQSEPATKTAPRQPAEFRAVETTIAAKSEPSRTKAPTISPVMQSIQALYDKQKTWQSDYNSKAAVSSQVDKLIRKQEETLQKELLKIYEQPGKNNPQMEEVKSNSAKIFYSTLKAQISSRLAASLLMRGTSAMMTDNATFTEISKIEEFADLVSTKLTKENINILKIKSPEDTKKFAVTAASNIQTYMKEAKGTLENSEKILSNIPTIQSIIETTSQAVSAKGIGTGRFV